MARVGRAHSIAKMRSI